MWCHRAVCGAVSDCDWLLIGMAVAAGGLCHPCGNSVCWPSSLHLHLFLLQPQSSPLVFLNVRAAFMCDRRAIKSRRGRRVEDNVCGVGELLLFWYQSRNTVLARVRGLDVSRGFPTCQSDCQHYSVVSLQTLHTAHLDQFKLTELYFKLLWMKLPNMSEMWRNVCFSSHIFVSLDCGRGARKQWCVSLFHITLWDYSNTTYNLNLHQTVQYLFKTVRLLCLSLKLNSLFLFTMLHLDIYPLLPSIGTPSKMRWYVLGVNSNK